MEKKRIIVLFIIVLVVFVGIFGYNQFKKFEQENRIRQEQQAILEQQKLEEEKRQAEEKRKQEELEEKENQYKNNSKYQAFKDETFKIRFYYDNESLKYGSMIAQAGKLALQERNGDNMFLYSTREIASGYDKNQAVQNYLSADIQDGFTVVENKDITISGIQQLEARYIEVQRANVTLRNYLIFKENGICIFSLGTVLNNEVPPAISDILNTIISE